MPTKKIEGYRGKDVPYTAPTPRSMNVDISSPSPSRGPAMSEFLSKMGGASAPAATSIEDHMSNISAGRPNIPDNYKVKK